VRPAPLAAQAWRAQLQHRRWHSCNIGAGATVASARTQLQHRCGRNCSVGAFQPVAARSRRDTLRESVVIPSTRHCGSRGYGVTPASWRLGAEALRRLTLREPVPAGAGRRCIGAMPTPPGPSEGSRVRARDGPAGQALGVDVTGQRQLGRRTRQGCGLCGVGCGGVRLNRKE
jgi:hypothetical protein